MTGYLTAVLIDGYSKGVRVVHVVKGEANRILLGMSYRREDGDALTPNCVFHNVPVCIWKLHPSH
jgi:hypothetical protein